MSRTISYCILVCFIVAIVFASGCIVPTKEDPAPAGSKSGGTNYLVPGTGSTPRQQTQVSAQNQKVPVTSPTPTRAPTVTNYLTLVPTYAVPTDNEPTYRDLSFLIEPTPIIPRYLEIYNNELSLKGYTVAYAYDLKKPPLVINFDIKPRVETRTIWYENRSGTYDKNGSRSDVYVTTHQFSPNAWFELIVRNKTTGTIVLNDGFGRQFGGNTKRTVSVRNYGDYQIDMSGNEVDVLVTMYVITGTV